MGSFSWIDCKDNGNIVINEKKSAYLLVPENMKEAVEKFFSIKINTKNNGIEEYGYYGYGRFNTVDVFEFALFLNACLGTYKDFVTAIENCELQIPANSDKFGGLWDFEKDKLAEQGHSKEEIEKLDALEKQRHYEGVKRMYERHIGTITMFRELYLNGDIKTIEDAYDHLGKDELRDAGIDCSCLDNYNAALAYPIKITHSKTLKYENAQYSLGDPEQGWCNIPKADLQDAIAERFKIAQELKDRFWPREDIDGDMEEDVNGLEK